MKIAWIGCGVMGKAMLQHLAAHNHQLTVYNRTKSKILDLESEHIHVCDTIEECVNNAEVVFTMVGYPKDVEEVYETIFKSAQKGAYLIDMTTSSPLLAQKLASTGCSFKVLDAPVSGGDIGARNAALSIMVGGNKEDYEAMLPLFELMGKNMTYVGPAGAGQHAKAANQIAVAGAIAAVSEAIHYVRLQNLDPQIVLNAISKGAAGSWQMDNNAPKIITKDYEPGFYIKHFVKDMHIVQEVMENNDETLNMLNSVCSMFENLEKSGYENEGTQALIEYYEGKH